MNSRKRNLERDTEEIAVKRSKSENGENQSFPNHRSEKSYGFVHRVGDYLKQSVSDNFYVKYLMNMLSANSTQRTHNIQKDIKSRDIIYESHTRSHISYPREQKENILDPDFRNSLQRPPLHLSSENRRTMSESKNNLSTKIKFLPFSISSDNPFVHRPNQYIKRSTQAVDKNAVNGNESNSEITMLPIPVVKHQKSPKKLFKASDSLKTGRIAKSSQRMSGSRLSNSSKQYSTAKECIRLADRDRYKQLLQQYTTMPIMKNISTPSSIMSSRSSSISSIAENKSILGSENLAMMFPSMLKKSKLNQDDSRRLSNRIHLTSTINSSKFSNRALHNKAPIVIDLADESSQSSSVDSSENRCVVKSSNEDKSNVRRSRGSPSVPSMKSVIEEKKKEYPFFSSEWTNNIREELNNLSKDLRPLIDIAEVETETFKQQREDRSVAIRQKLRERLKTYVKPSYYEFSVDLVEDEEEELLPELTDEMEMKIDDGFLAPLDKILVDGFNLTIRGRDIETLKSLNWLNDEVINFYFNLLVDRGKLDNYPSVYTFNTFFYPKLISSGHEALRRWTRKVDIFTYDYIIIPVHLGMHWCLAVIDFKAKAIKYYDSLQNNNNECLSCLRQYLQDESLDKKRKVFDMSDWTSVTPKEIPVQMNGSDCGMFACKYAEYITRDVKITFCQEDMPYFRRRMVYEILTKRLL